MKILPIYINRKSKIFQTFLLFFILSILSYFLVFSKTNYKIMSNIITVFLEILFPSLFPFILFSNILTYSDCFDLIAKSKFNKIIKNFLKISSHGASAIIFGFLFGYPNGARYVNQLYERNKINYDEAEYLLLFINNASPTFILSSVGIGMLQNIKLGTLLLISHVFASILVGIIYRFKYRINKKNVDIIKEIENTMNLSFDIIYSSISKSLFTLGIIFGFMTIFILLHNYLITILNYIVSIDNNIQTSLLCIMEISSGLKDFTKLDIDLKILLPVISFFLGFSSLSIIFQIFSSVYLNKFKLKTILKGKLVQGILSYIITYILVNIPYVYEYINIGKKVNSNIDNINISSCLYNNHIFIAVSIFLLHILIFVFFIILKKKRPAKS